VKIHPPSMSSRSKNIKTKLNISETPSSLSDKNLPSLTTSNQTLINIRMLSVNQKILAQTFKNNLSAKVTKQKSNLMHTKSTLTLLLLKITHLNQKFSSWKQLALKLKKNTCRQYKAVTNHILKNKMRAFKSLMN
jgi:hypothetical protein